MSDHVAPIECSSHDGITIGLIDAMITLANTLNERLEREARRMKRRNNPIEWEWFSDDVQAALTDLAGNKAVQNLLHPYDENAMRIIREGARLIATKPATPGIWP